MKTKLRQYLLVNTPFTYIIVFIALASLIFSGYGIYKYKSLNKLYISTVENLASTTLALDDSNRNLIEAESQILDLNSRLSGEVSRNNAFDEQIQSITSVVGQLDKLSKTDRELLQKYSKVYFLSENFVPSSLSDIDPLFLFRKEKPEKIHSNVRPFLENLIRSSASDSVSILVLSGYRSFGTQANLKANYKITYGAGTANKFSADQGYSEHQLGSTVDFTTTRTGEVLNDFDKTESYEWLTKNAHKFGFVLSYPKNNIFYQYEPWHWRFVGVELATKLHNENKYFYDLEQREINNFLVKIFD